MEGQWRNYYTGAAVDLSFAAADTAAGDNGNCAILVGAWNGWSDWKCLVPKVENIGCAFIKYIIFLRLT